MINYGRSTSYVGVEGLLLHTTQKLYIEYNHMIVVEIIAVNIYYIVQSKQLP